MDTKAKLPGCMMPDGADPCPEYQALLAANARMAEALRDLLLTWPASVHIPKAREALTSSPDLSHLMVVPVYMLRAIANGAPSGDPVWNELRALLQRGRE